MIKPISKHSSVRLLTAALFAIAGMTAATAAETNAPATPKPASKIDEFLGDSAVVAKGKGVEIKRNQIDEVITNYKAALAASGQAASSQQVRIMEQRVLNDLIGTQLLLAKATEADKKKGGEQLETALQKIKTEAKLTDAEFEEKLALQLRSQGITREEWYKRQTDQAVVLAVIERELKINVTDEQVKKFYDEHPAKFEEPEKVRVCHILISTKDPTDPTRDPAMSRELPEAQKAAKRKQIEDLLKRARAGEDFSKLAKEFSEDPRVKENKGEYTLARGDAFVPEFKAAAFSLGTNQVSEVVTTVYGYHILKLMEKIPARKVELAKFSDRVKQDLKQQEIQKLLPDYMEKLQKDAGVEILDEKLKPAETPAAASPFKPATPDAKK